jgi:Domain of unknown function (DUF1792).
VTYPEVRSEYETVAELLKGKSIARFGDGELKIVYGAGYVRAEPNEALTHELRKVLQKPHPNCLVGIPTMDREGPKYDNWLRHKRRFSRVLSKNVQYYSAFISRPDSAPWIMTHSFALEMQQLWEGKNVAVICEPDNSILPVIKMSALDVAHIECPHREAYFHIDDFQDAIIRYSPDIAILSIGPTASCLANRLAGDGIQAIDIGSAGGFLRKILMPSNKSRK